MTRSHKKANPLDQSPTYISIVEQCLKESNDFLSISNIMAITGLKQNRVSASLYSLYKRSAVDCVSTNGVQYWFATPDTDNRRYKQGARTPEAPGSRHRIGSGMRKRKNVELAKSLIEEHKQRPRIIVLTEEMEKVLKESVGYLEMASKILREVLKILDRPK